MGKAYDPVYKIEVCKQVESGMATVPEISRETGISENTLYTWMKRYRENKDLREENEILKKAAAGLFDGEEAGRAHEQQRDGHSRLRH